MEKSITFLGGTAVVFALGLMFAFSSGFRSSSLIVATTVSTRALSPTVAFILCSLFECLGALTFGTAVAATIGHGMFGDVSGVAHRDVVMVVGSGLGAAFIWGFFCWLKAVPISNNHALFGGLTGASMSAWGSGHLHNTAIAHIFLILVLSPTLAFLLSVLITNLIRYLGTWMTPKAMKLSESLHIMSCLSVAAADGSNNGQMVMGVLMLAGGLAPVAGAAGGELDIPVGVRLMVAGSISLGVLLGGRRILKKMGMSFYRIQVTQGLGAQMTSAAMILSCLLNGFPSSTSQVITGSIIGAGVAKNPRSVKWNQAKDILLSWAFTLPGVGLLAALVFQIVKMAAKVL